MPPSSEELAESARRHTVASSSKSLELCAAGDCGALCGLMLCLKSAVQNCVWLRRMLCDVLDIKQRDHNLLQALTAVAVCWRMTVACAWCVRALPYVMHAAWWLVVSWMRYCCALGDHCCWLAHCVCVCCHKPCMQHDGRWLRGYAVTVCWVRITACALCLCVLPYSCMLHDGLWVCECVTDVC